MNTLLQLSILLVFTASCFADQDVAKPLVVVSGSDSKVTRGFYDLVTSADEWARLWAQHLGVGEQDVHRPPMKIDFDRYMIVAIFRGPRIHSRQVEIESVAEGRHDLQSAGSRKRKPCSRPRRSSKNATTCDSASRVWTP